MTQTKRWESAKQALTYLFTAITLAFYCHCRVAAPHNKLLPVSESHNPTKAEDGSTCAKCTRGDKIPDAGPHSERCPSGTIRWDLPLEPLGYRLTDYSITGDILPQEQAALDSVAEWMKSNPWMRIFIVVKSEHFKESSSGEQSQLQETRRVGSRVIQELINRGISEERLSVMALGGASATGKTPSQRELSFRIDTQSLPCAGAYPEWRRP